MTRGVPAGEGGSHDAPTAPLLRVPQVGPRPTGGPGAAGGPESASGHPRTTERYLPRWLRRALIVVLAIALAGALAFAGLMLATPSVSTAPLLAQAFDRAHGAAYPGPLVPERFAAALVATEDHRFYSEPGFDPIAIGRVIVGRLTGQPDQGGATVYQQLAKMLYTSGRSGAGVEAEQLILGIKLDLTYSKPQILRLYADVAYFGHGYYGLAQASCGYFGVTPAGLTWPQAALLAGLVQAPSADNPVAHFTVARAREAHVLGRLVATGTLTQAQAAKAYRAPLHLVSGPGTGCAAR
jgi:membrane peptidoglycan carboxypeptidase